LRNQLNSRYEGRPYQLVVARKQHLIKGYFEGVGILTRLPVLSSDLMGLGYEGRVALRINVQLPTGTPVDFVAVHLHHVHYDHQARLEQVMTMLGWLSERNPVAHRIIAGDFNETPNGLAILQMKETYDSAYEKVVGHEPLATFPTALVRGDWAGCLDYIFVTRGIAGISATKLFCTTPSPTDDTLYPSDHVGIISTIQIEKI
jgi:endonuclease/exonuclease/phosphatase family metal-dependent hydrolase